MEKIVIGKYVVSKAGFGTPRGTSKEDSIWDEDSVIAVVYNVAPRVYYRKRWPQPYTIDDFVQDSAMYILDLYRKNYFPTDQDNIDPIIYRLLDGFFIINKYQRIKKEEYGKIYLDRYFKHGNHDSSSDQSVLQLAVDNNYDERDSRVAIGLELAEELIDRMDFQPYKTRKYKYVGYLNGETLALSEKNLAKLILMGMTMHDILDVYGNDVSNISTSTKATYIFHRVKITIDRMKEVIAGISEGSESKFAEYVSMAFDDYRDNSEILRKIIKPVRAAHCRP